MVSSVFGKLDASRQPPADGGLGVRRRRYPRGEHAGDARVLDDKTSIHGFNSSVQ